MVVVMLCVYFGVVLDMGFVGFDMGFWELWFFLSLLYLSFEIIMFLVEMVLLVIVEVVYDNFLVKVLCGVFFVLLGFNIFSVDLGFFEFVFVLIVFDFGVNWSMVGVVWGVDWLWFFVYNFCFDFGFDFGSDWLWMFILLNWWMSGLMFVFLFFVLGIKLVMGFVSNY